MIAIRFEMFLFLFVKQSLAIGTLYLSSCGQTDCVASHPPIRILLGMSYSAAQNSWQSWTMCCLMSSGAHPSHSPSTQLLCLPSFWPHISFDRNSFLATSTCYEVFLQTNIVYINVLFNCVIAMRYNTSLKINQFHPGYFDFGCHASMLCSIHRFPDSFTRDFM